MAEEAGHSELTDYELLRRAGDGERQAFELVYQRYQQVVYRFARALTGRPDVADDAGACVCHRLWARSCVHGSGM
jgi:DNA-directed RNA polymerase specialized sigma24 family protein